MSARTVETVTTAKMSAREIIGCKQDSLYNERKEDFFGRSGLPLPDRMGRLVDG